MKRLIALAALALAANHLLAADNTCATVHGCPPSGMSAQEQDQWRNETGGNTKPAKGSSETARTHSIHPTIGMRISAGEFVKQYDSHCEVHRTITAHNETDEVACGGGYAGELVGNLPPSEYIYIDNGVITAIQKREPTARF
jgi:hypothetical protein